MILPGPDLPDDVDALKAMIIALNTEKAATDAEIARMKVAQQKADERITNLTAILKVLQRAQKGTRSERLRLAINDDQIDFAFEEAETDLAAIDRELGKVGED
jgi:transposase